MRSNFAIPATMLLAAPIASAQSDVSPSHKFTWGENIGFMNWRDAGDPVAQQGVRFHDAPNNNAFLSGFVWAENTGWINLGDGSPADGRAYGNTDGADCGVNIDDGGSLSGLGWGENIGWVNFSTKGALKDSNQDAKFDFAAHRIRGYAWGENVGWINMDDDEDYVAFLCVADFNADGVVDTRDVLAFLNAWVARDSRADINGDGVIDTRDVLAFLNLWTAGC
ncbi:MAG: hypothetical protein IPJ41_00255 [Phycisphaerales bacterium]|nr:hypothetical protein [Phycisphaerales bacterium]